MDFELSAEQKQVQGAARRLAKGVVEPRAAAIDRTGEYPEDVFAAFASAGLFGASLPLSCGGLGLGTTGLALCIEEVAKYCSASALMLLLAHLPTAPLVYSGRRDLCDKYCRPIAAGSARAAFALTEPTAGSDVWAIATRARPDGGGYVLTGQKQYISGASVADWFVVVAKVAEREMALFVVERNTPGVAVAPPMLKMGVHGIPLVQIYLDDVHVTAAARVDDGNGFRLLMHSLNSTRPLVAARGLGLAEGAMSYTLAYARERRTFGKALIEHEALQFMLADLAIAIEASRLLTYQATWFVDRGEYTVERAAFLSMAKAFATETAVKASGDCLQLLGAAGYVADYPMERFYRDAKQLTIVEGTSQVQRLIIADALRNMAIRYD
jgi:alkylation response protein AidB-like acyl-CoA dehydrogenase